MSQPNHALASSKPIWLGLLLLILGNLLATFVDVLVKLFDDVSGIYQYLFLRQATLFLLILPFFLLQPKAKRKLSHTSVHLLRAGLTSIGGGCVVLALKMMGLASANVVFYAAPVLTMLFAAWLLQEKLHSSRLVAIVCCFLGVVLALRPEGFNFGVLAAATAAVCIAGYNLSVRLFGGYVSTVSVMFWGCVFTLPTFFVLSLFNWQPLSLELVYLVLGSALCLAGYQLCCVFAYSNAEAGAITIAEYAGLVFAAWFGWLWFHEEVDIWMAAGIALIILPMLWHSKVESKRHRRLITADDQLV